jgi:heterotetrameric sarcosine oxidase gamma subunit
VSEIKVAPARVALSWQPSLTISIMPDRTKLLLRGRCGNSRFVAAVAAATGSALPSKPNSASGDDPEILWLSPTGWLLIGSDHRLASLAPTLSNLLGGVDGDLIDVGDEYVHFRIEGAATSDLLATCCPLDLSIPAFPQRSTARTMVASIAAIVCRPSDDGALELYVDRGYGEHLLKALEAQAVEFR